MKKVFFCSPFMWKKAILIKNVQEIAINMQTNAIKYQIMILEKNRKRNHQILSFYVGEIRLQNLILD
jgi:hypothetical protein